ncbi:hypothetical protein [Nocardia brasiliensis]
MPQVLGAIPRTDHARAHEFVDDFVRASKNHAPQRLPRKRLPVRPKAHAAAPSARNALGPQRPHDQAARGPQSDCAQALPDP